MRRALLTSVFCRVEQAAVVEKETSLKVKSFSGDMVSQFDTEQKFLQSVLQSKSSDSYCRQSTIGKGKLGFHNWNNAMSLFVRPKSG